MFKKYVQKKLEKYVQKYFKKHPNVKLIVVTGSVGKTSTKRAIGTILGIDYRVRMHVGGHATALTVPLGILGVRLPENIKSINAWLQVFKAARARIKSPTDVDFIIQELGADKPGEMAVYGRYLHANIAVVTAVTPEHMEFFQTIDAVAAEELSVGGFSDLVLINRDDIDDRFAQYLNNANLVTYGSTGLAEYRFEIHDFTVENGYSGNLVAPEFGANLLPASIKVVGEHSIRPIMGAVAVALKCGLLGPEIVQGIGRIKPVPGRMNLLRGIGGATIIDDSYNSSPAATAAAIQAFYSIDAPLRIALLGDMNELGSLSQQEHEKIGHMLNINMVEWVVTVGEESRKYLAPIAHSHGCQIRSFNNAIDAASFVRSVTQPQTLILVKGSQGGIFLEEGVKILCDMTEDVNLVRQSERWMDVKNDFFARIR